MDNEIAWTEAAERQSSETISSAHSWRRPFTWLSLLAIGWILYELTTKPTLGAVAVCLKFGWEDFRTAIWLRRNDPRRIRGRACFWLYLASGLAKTAGVAGLMSFAFVAVSPKGPAAQGPRWAAIMEMAAWTGLATLAGLSCAVLTFAYAAVLAGWGGFKLWLSRDVHGACRRNDWPPYGPNVNQENRLNYLLLVALLVVFLPPLLLLLGFAAVVQFGGPTVAAAFSVLMWGVPVLVLRCKDRLSKWLAASHPRECWDTDSELPSEAEGMAETSAPAVK